MCRPDRVAILLSLALLSGCRLATDPFAQLRVVIVAAPTVVGPNAPAAITVTVTNAGRRSVTIETNPCPDRFLVTTTTGVIVGPAEKACLLYSVQLELKPGAQHVFQASWAASGRRGVWDAPPAVLAPGEYRVIGAVGTGDRSSRSAPLPIRVHE